MTCPEVGDIGIGSELADRERRRLLTRVARVSPEAGEKAVRGSGA